MTDPGESQLVASYRSLQICPKKRVERCTKSPNGQVHRFDLFVKDWWLCRLCLVDARVKDFPKRALKCKLCETPSAVLHGPEKRCFLCVFEALTRLELRLSDEEEDRHL